MRFRLSRVVILALLIVGVGLLAAPVLAHVPGFAGENTSHETAMHLDDGAKSRSIYATLGQNEARYFEVHLEPGERLQASVFTPTAGAVTPGIVVYGPAVEPSGTVPAWVEIPEGMNARVVPGTRTAHPEFEPFTPAAYYQTAATSLPAEDDHYWIAVYEQDGSPGRVGTAIGYVETFSTTEFLLVPVDLLGVHEWEGDSLVLLVGPYILATLFAGWLWTRRLDGRPTIPQLGLVIAGVLFVGGALLTGIQLALAIAAAGFQAGAILSLVFVVIPAAIGIWVLTLGISRERSHSLGRRAALLGAAVLGLGTWGGLLVGPILLAGVALLPSLAPSN